MHLTFYIHGNQDDPTGNPIPFQRAIKGMWREASQRYMEWQSYVRMQANDIFANALPNTIYKINLNPLTRKIVLGKCYARVGTVIYWKNNAHGDADNVHKGILDALFQDDKNVIAGSYHSGVSSDKKGIVRVDIEIFLPNNK